MASARHSSAARREYTDPSARPQRAPSPRPRPVTRQLPRSKVSWDRKFRMVMLVVVVLIGWMAVRAAIAMVATHAQAVAEIQQVQRYVREDHRLEREAKDLTQKRTIEQRARQLGMIKKGEQSFVVTGVKPEGT